MSRSRAILLSLLLLPVGLLAAPPMLHVVGNQIETAAGCPIRLVGVDVDCLEWNAQGINSGTQPILSSVEEAVSAWHANFVRIPIDQDWWDGNAQSSRGSVNQATYQGLVTAIVNYCQSANVYCDIDLQWSGDGATGTAIQQYSMPDENSLTFWTSVATLYKNNTSVLFDMFNEPYPNGNSDNATAWSLWKSGGTTTDSPSFTTPGLQEILATIRATGALNICIAGGLEYSFDFQGITPLTDPGNGGNAGNGIVYAAHIYNNNGNDTAAGWNSDIVPALSYGPVEIEEFGNSANTTDNGTFVNSVLAWMDGGNSSSYDFGGMAWNFGVAASPYLLTSFTGYTTTSYEGSQVYTWLQGITQQSCAATTNTDTPTVTPTDTRTATGTDTRTTTDTPSATPTLSSTTSSTPTRTSSPSDTPSLTGTLTPTGSPSLTGTLTSTGTLSPTRKASPTATGSSTGTLSPTLTPSATLSPSATATRSDTGTLSPTLSPSPSSTATPSGTATGTLTATRSASATLSATGTSSATLTPSSTATPSSSATPSPTASWTSSATPSFSRTATPTDSPSAIPSLTASPSPSASPTATSSFTVSPVDSPTETRTPASPTDSSTDTATSTDSATAAASASPSPSATATATPSPSRSATPSPSYTATQSPTATPMAPQLNAITATASVGSPMGLTLTGSGFASPPTVLVDGVALPSTDLDYVGPGEIIVALPAQGAGTGALSISVKNPSGTVSNVEILAVKGSTPPPTANPGGPLQILGLVPVPNPNPDVLSVDLSGPASSVAVQVYTKAFVLALSFSQDHLQAGWNALSLPAAWRSLPVGLYYVRIQAQRGAASSSPKFTKALIFK